MKENLIKKYVILSVILSGEQEEKSFKGICKDFA